MVALLTVLSLPLPVLGKSQFGELRLHADNQVAKKAGVWVDEKYIGYVEELKGSKTIRLLPGDHKIEVREAGYTDFMETVSVLPNRKQTVRVALLRDPRAALPMVTGQVKFWILPERAAILVDNQYAGYAQQFGGPGRGMLLSPGKHHITVELPGYEPFDTEIDVRAHQQYDIQTQLLKSTAASADAALGNAPGH